MSVLLVLAALAASPPLCRQTHYTADGQVIESMRPDPGNTSASSASAHASGSNSASSSVSVSSSSDGRSRSSSVTQDDGAHRSVTVRRDGDTCTIVIDDRPMEGESR